jgi:prepilin-type N-terminal cleavage/methylation domain-containing protein
MDSLKSSSASARYSAPKEGLSRSCLTGTHDRRSDWAFTLIELLVVIAIVAILAGLAISTLGNVNKKGAESRARAEVAALSSAIESFKIDKGFYPADATTLFTNLCPTQAGAKVFFEPSPSMLNTNLFKTNQAGQPVMEVQFIDPWANPYGYSNYNNTYFELWSTVGSTNASSTNNWIRN